MADTTTELEVLDQIVDVLGGQSGQYETVVPTLQQILALLGGGGGGYNPSLSVGRADALTGADETAQWATRESTGSGAAIVRSVQGASVVWNQRALQRAGSFGSNGLTFSARTDGGYDVSGTVSDNPIAQIDLLTYTEQQRTENFVIGHKYLFWPKSSFNDTVDTRFASLVYSGGADGYFEARMPKFLTVTQTPTIVVFRIMLFNHAGETMNTTIGFQIFDLTTMFGAGNEPTTVEEFERMYPESYYPYSAPTLKPVQIAGIASTDANGDALDGVEWETQTLRAAGSVADMLYSDHVDVKVGERAYQSGDESDATVRTDGTTTYYPLTTPTTTPITPALPMTYRVEQGGTEAIIVPDGEISAAPVLTVAEGESAGELVMDALACIAAPDGPVAKANHAVGTYLTMQGKLYKVTSAIAVGETIKSGTNVSQTTVMAELIARTA